MNVTNFLRASVMLSLIISFLSCTRLPMAQSYWEGRQADNQDLQVSGYNTESDIRYTVSNDKARLYFNVSTFNRETGNEMLKNGVTLYVSSGNKEDRTKYLKFPLPNGFAQVVGAGGTKSINNANSLQKPAEKKLSPLAIWVSGNDVKFLNPSDSEIGFEAHFGKDSSGKFNYRVAIPIEAIEPRRFTAIKSLTIGVVIDKAHTKGVAGGGYENRRVNGMGRGMRGGHGGMGMRGNDSRTSHDSQNLQAQSIKIWFSTKPAKP
jgi:hypothetical protein